MLLRAGLAWVSVLFSMTMAMAQWEAMPPSTPISDPAVVTAPPLLDFSPQPLVTGPLQGADLPPLAAGPQPPTSYQWQLLPDGLMYPAYLANGRESRISAQWLQEEDQGGLWDITLGGHVGIFRYGTSDPLLPQGFQADIEGAAFPRLTLDWDRDLVSVDFRFGVPLTLRQGPFETKLAYYHLSSHLGDEFWMKHPDLERINYSRDVFVWGIAYRIVPDLRLYGEAGWAVYTSGGSEPWEFQFGVDYSSVRLSSALGSPFFALNARLRQEVDFGGNFTAQTGWQWRGQSGHLLRTGFSYFNGKADQGEFFRQQEEQFAFGIWYDY